MDIPLIAALTAIVLIGWAAHQTANDVQDLQERVEALERERGTPVALAKT